MQQKISFCLISNRGGSVKQCTASKTTLHLLVCLILSVLGGLGYVIYDYVNLRDTSFNNRQLNHAISSQQDEIQTQRKQIQGFAQEINQLKVKLAKLKSAENKIRVIANLEPKEEQKGLFGIGGSLPEDIDASLDLKKKHNSLVREMNQQMDHLKVAIKSQEDGFGTLLKYMEEERNLLACTPAIRPTTGWVTSRFGHRTSPFTGAREFHKGLDIASRKGTLIVATANGVVSYVGWKGQLGRIVVIDHGYGLVTRYGHIKKAFVKRGETVKRGQKIAEIGSTGRSTGPHVHYEVLLNGLPVNPKKYILN